MDYYIQGDEANADKIKAAFEKLGMSDLSGYNFGNGHALFYTYDCGGNKVIAIVCVNLHVADIIKTHPDYKELELPVEPKFKVGDWLAANEPNNYARFVYIEGIEDSLYLISKIGGAFGSVDRPCITFVEEYYHPFSINDAKDGDVLVLNGKPFIYSPKYGKNYCYIDNCGQFRVNFSLVFEGNCVLPATKEQRDLLFAKMQEAGYQWDADKKELHKIKPNYDISNYHAGMPVLVRADNVCRWNYSVFSHITGNKDWQFAVCNGVSFTQCIPFEGNEHLLGTTDPCDERFINW